MSSLSFHGPSSSSRTTRVTLTPTPGFVVKSTATNSSVFALSTPTTKSDASSSGSSSKSPNLLEPTQPSARTLVIPQGIKVFLNIAWDKNVPAPPPVSEDAIRRAMMGEDIDSGIVESGKDGLYIVPVVVSEPREDKDKSGKPSIVFDCVFNASLKSRSLKDNDFRLYLIELALEHVEEKARVALSRQIGTPNIASKGKLAPRTVLIPNSLLNPSVVAKGSATVPSKTLIQEVVAQGGAKSKDKKETAEMKEQVKDKPEEVVKPKSILKTTATAPVGQLAQHSKKPLIEELNGSLNPHPQNDRGRDKGSMTAQVPRWSWFKENERIGITVEVPKLTHTLHESSALDIEPRRVLLSIPGIYALDINLDLSDAQIGKVTSWDDAKGLLKPEDTQVEQQDNVDDMKIKGHNAGEALKLKRQRDFDVDRARAEWRVAEGQMVIWV